MIMGPHSALDMTKVTPASERIGDDDQETQDLMALARKATDFLSSFRWVRSIKATYQGISIAGVFGVFLFDIEPSEAGVDEWLWVVVGDVPSAYLVADDAPNPAKALRVYLDEMQRWVDAAQAGKPVVDLIPVNVPPTKEAAVQLQSRLVFLRDKVLSEYAPDLLD
jgi:hypothetical protein